MITKLKNILNRVLVAAKTYPLVLISSLITGNCDFIFGENAVATTEARISMVGPWHFIFSWILFYSSDK